MPGKGYARGAQEEPPPPGAERICRQGERQRLAGEALEVGFSPVRAVVGQPGATVTIVGPQLQVNQDLFGPRLAKFEYVDEPDGGRTVRVIEGETNVIAFAERDRAEGFDLARPPLQRMSLLALAIIASLLVGPANMAFLGDVVGRSGRDGVAERLPGVIDTRESSVACTAIRRHAFFR